MVMGPRMYFCLLCDPQTTFLSWVITLSQGDGAWVTSYFHNLYSCTGPILGSSKAGGVGWEEDTRQEAKL